eukprot:SAG11_NODE_645_length_7983_cov_5.727596_5_plen_68_part_00
MTQCSDLSVLPACSAVQEMSKVVHAGYEALHENATDWEGELSDARKGELAQEAIDDVSSIAWTGASF